MISKLSEMVTGDQAVTFLIMAILLGYFIYKEWPEFKRRVTSGATDKQRLEDADRSIANRLDAIEARLKGIDDKLMNDYNRINMIQREAATNRQMLEAEIEEQEIIVRALLGVLGGLQELGANGPTKAAEKELRDYLCHMAHGGKDVRQNVQNQPE